eukprot:12210459-Prorocentrum_lima.AAC.1
MGWVSRTQNSVSHSTPQGPLLFLQRPPLLFKPGQACLLHRQLPPQASDVIPCLLYTSDAADDM